MILLIEPGWTGTTHAPVNAAMVQIIARAFPGERLCLLAEASHLAELSADPLLAALPCLTTRAIAIDRRWQGRPHIVSWRRMAREFAVLHMALRQVPQGEPCLVVLLSTTATTSFAAAWALRLSGRSGAVQVVFHGNLNDAMLWRSANPLRRAVDTRSSLEARFPVPLRFVVLEETIRDALAAHLPGTLGRTDVLPSPVSPAESAAATAVTLGWPLRIGFVGLGTAEKGFDEFLGMAARLRARHGDRVAFVHVGRLQSAATDPALAVLEQPSTTQPLPRTEFTRRLAGLHYILLPFRRGYYDLSGSGALMDALAWGKPILATRVPLTRQFFAEFGEIGVLGDDMTALEQAMDTLVAMPDAVRYGAQCAALAAARLARGPEALAQRYRRLIGAGFPGLGLTATQDVSPIDHA